MGRIGERRREVVIPERAPVPDTVPAEPARQPEREPVSPGGRSA